MTILYYSKDDGTYMTAWQKCHFIEELEDAGHSIHIINPLAYTSFDQANEELLKAIKNQQKLYDLFMCPHGDEYLYIDTLKSIKSVGVPTLLICFDNLHAPYMHKTIAPYFDLVWLTSWETKALFDKWGCNTIFLPYASNPKSFSPNFSKEINVVGFIGTPYGTRTNKINKLVANGINCHIYTNAIIKTGHTTALTKSKTLKDYLNLISMDCNLSTFPIGRRILLSKLIKKINAQKEALNVGSEYLTVMPSVSFKEMNYLYSNFSLSLGITEVWDTYVLNKPVHKLHLRTFEIPMCGGIQFAPYIEELSNYFMDNKEIVMYNNEEEYIDKAKYYLQESKEGIRKKMKIAAHQRAINEHTWQNRFNKVFSILFNKQ